MDDNIPIVSMDPFYSEDPTEQINKVFRRQSIDENKSISELAFGNLKNTNSNQDPHG